MPNTLMPIYLDDDHITLTGAGMMALTLYDLAQRSLRLLIAPILDAEERARLIADLTDAVGGNDPQTYEEPGYLNCQKT